MLGGARQAVARVAWAVAGASGHGYGGVLGERLPVTDEGFRTPSGLAWGWVVRNLREKLAEAAPFIEGEGRRLRLPLNLKVGEVSRRALGRALGEDLPRLAAYLLQSAGYREGREVARERPPPGAGFYSSFFRVKAPTGRWHTVEVRYRVEEELGGRHPLYIHYLRVAAEEPPRAAAGGVRTLTEELGGGAPPVEVEEIEVNPAAAGAGLGGGAQAGGERRTEGGLTPVRSPDRGVAEQLEEILKGVEGLYERAPEGGGQEEVARAARPLAERLEGLLGRLGGEVGKPVERALESLRLLAASSQLTSTQVRMLLSDAKVWLRVALQQLAQRQLEAGAGRSA
jgi:hypothetical protein